MIMTSKAAGLIHFSDVDADALAAAVPPTAEPLHLLVPLLPPLGAAGADGALLREAAEAGGLRHFDGNVGHIL